MIIIFLPLFYLFLLYDSSTCESVLQSFSPKSSKTQFSTNQAKERDLLMLYTSEEETSASKPNSPPTPIPTIALAPKTLLPTLSPTEALASDPTSNPTDIIEPTTSPTIITMTPSKVAASPIPTVSPTESLSSNPSSLPTVNPTVILEPGDPTSIPTQTTSPSQFPSHSPTERPTEQPTLNPTEIQTTFPTQRPTTASPTGNPTTDLPSQFPTFSPTSTQTKQPTHLPTTAFPFPYSDTYFNYNPFSEYGPQHWEKVEIDRDNIFEDFGDDNICNEKNDKESPVNVVHKIECLDDHIPGLNRGRNKFSDLEFSILPSALHVNLGDKDTAPKVDFSNEGDAIEALFINVKVPSEHYLFGKQYKGEFQIYFEGEEEKACGREGKCFLVASILMDDSQNQENPALEFFIREWEEISWKKKIECDMDPNKPFYTRTYFTPTPEELQEVFKVVGSGARSDYDLFMFWTTAWFCGYEGSLTEPPCTDHVKWRVLDIPMQFSTSQYERIQKLIVNYLDDDCQRATSAFKGEVNRPLQPNDDVYCCTSREWEFDVDEDPLFFPNLWPDDYHGWRGIENLKNMTTEEIMKNLNKTSTYTYITNNDN